MHLYEYEGKRLLAEAQIPIPRGGIAETPQQAADLAKAFGQVVLKAQLKRGGRGKLGLIRVVTSDKEAYSMAEELLRSDVGGEKVHSLLVEERLDIEKELYAAVINDRSTSSPVLLCSSIGGMDIEEVARTHPGSVAKRTIDIRTGLRLYHAYGAAKACGLTGQLLRSVGPFLERLYQVYRKNDAELVEVNPLCVTTRGDLVAADARVVLDDNADFRRNLDFASGRPSSEREALARKLQMAYIELNPEGEIGVIFGGAGLGMTILDLINEAIGPDKLTCFLDIGGRADKYADEALKICLTFPRLKAILVHAIGGMGQVEEFGQILCRGIKELRPRVPIFVNLAGTGESAAVEYLSQEVPKLREEGIEIEWSSFATVDDPTVFSRRGGVDNIEFPIKRLLEMAGYEYRRNPPPYMEPRPDWEEATRELLIECMANRPEEKYRALARAAASH